MPGAPRGRKGRAASIRTAVAALLAAPDCDEPARADRSAAGGAAARFREVCGAEVARAARAAIRRFKLAAGTDTLAAVEAGVRELLWENDGARARAIVAPKSDAVRSLGACVVRAAGRLADERRKFGGHIPPPASAAPTNANSAAHEAAKRELLDRLAALVAGESPATRWIFERYCHQVKHDTGSKRKLNLSLIHRESTAITGRPTGITRDCIRNTLWRLHFKARRELGVGLPYLPPRRGPRKRKPPEE